MMSDVLTEMCVLGGCAAHRGVGQQLQHQRVGQVQPKAARPHKFHGLGELLIFRQANALRVLHGQ